MTSQNHQKHETWRYLLGAVSAAALVGATLYLVLYWDEATAIHKKIIYADGCVEEYVNDELTTDVCEEGRLLEEQYKQQVGGRWVLPNFILNTTANTS